MLLDKKLNYGRHIIEDFLKESMPFSTVLDICAGSGEDLDSARRVNEFAKLYAIEYHEFYIANLKMKNTIVYQLNVENETLPFDDESIDIIVCNQTLEHMKEIFWIFHEISRILVVGGNLIIGVPNLASLLNRFLLMIGQQPTPIQLQSDHVRGFTYPGIRKFVNICWNGGYKLVNFHGSNFYPFPPMIAKPLADWFPKLAWGIFMRYRKEEHYSGDFLKYLKENNLDTNFYKGRDG